MNRTIPGLEILEGECPYTRIVNYKSLHKEKKFPSIRSLQAYFSSLIPGQSICTGKPSYDHVYEHHKSQTIQLSTIESLPSTSSRISNGKVVKPKKRRKRQCITMKMPKSKKTSSQGRNQNKKRNSQKKSVVGAEENSDNQKLKKRVSIPKKTTDGNQPKISQKQKNILKSPVVVLSKVNMEDSKNSNRTSEKNGDSPKSPIVVLSKVNIENLKNSNEKLNSKRRLEKSTEEKKPNVLKSRKVSKSKGKDTKNKPQKVSVDKTEENLDNQVFKKPVTIPTKKRKSTNQSKTLETHKDIQKTPTVTLPKVNIEDKKNSNKKSTNKRRSKECKDEKESNVVKSTKVSKNEMSKQKKPRTEEKANKKRKKPEDNETVTDNMAKEENGITPRPSSYQNRRRTLYSPKTFELSADLTKVFSDYVSY